MCGVGFTFVQRPFVQLTPLRDTVRDTCPCVSLDAFLTTHIDTLHLGLVTEDYLIYVVVADHKNVGMSYYLTDWSPYP